MKRYIFIISLFYVINFVYAQDGVIDSVFGTNGKITIHIPDLTLRSKALLVLDDDSFLVGINLEYNHFGSIESRGFNIYKFDKNGVLDTNFGENGLLFFPNEGNKRSFIISLDRYNDKVFVHYQFKDANMISIMDFSGDIIKSFELNSRIDYFPNLKFQSLRKFLVAGIKKINQKYVFVIQRYFINGQQDLSFGTDGDLTFTRNSLTYAYGGITDFDIDNDGNIVILGENYSPISHPFIAKFDNNGHPDTSFGAQGIQYFQVFSNSIYGLSENIKLLPDGSMLVGLNAVYSGGTGGFYGIKPTVVKFNSNGSYDLSFANNGKYVFETLHNANDSMRFMSIQPDGKILIGGGSSYAYPIFDTDYYMTRLNPDGSLDTGFANDGFFVTDFNDYESCYIFSVQFQKDAILALGVENTIDNFNYDASIFRLKADSLKSICEFSKIYPNPFDNQVIIEDNSYFDRVEMYNMLGQLILTENFDEVKKYIIDSKSLDAGIYNLVLYYKNQLINYKKLIKH